jgi:DNA-binding IclR family transcriptional regulator
MPTNNYISVVDKVMRVLEAMRGKRELPLREIASSAGLIKSSTFRILFTLERLGYVEKSAGGRYALTAQLAHLARDERPGLDLAKLTEPFMTELWRRFGETVNLGVLDNGEVLYILVQESLHDFRSAGHAGTRLPVHSTALGKCLLCRLPRNEVEAILKKHPLLAATSRTIRVRPSFYRELALVRSRGYAIDNQETARGARCVAAPISTPGGDVCAAISISGPAARMIPQTCREIAEALTKTCGKIARLVVYTNGLKTSPPRS